MCMGRNKQIIHAPKKCGGELEVEYTEDNIPILRCNLCDHEIDDWVRWETKYKNMWELEENWSDKKNHLSVLLGYFCARYKDYYGIGYTLSLNEKGLFRGPEINVMRRIYRMLHQDVMACKDYIDFIFARKVQKRKKRISSLSYLAVQDFVQEYRLAKESQKKIRRSTNLPEKMVRWVEEFTPGVREYVELRDFGDLNLLLTHVRNGHIGVSDDVGKFINKLKERKYIDDSLCIVNWSD